MIVVALCALSVGAASVGHELDLVRPNPSVVAVDASHHAYFGLRWRRAVVRTGLFRKVNETFGRPAVSSKHGIVVVGTGEGEVLGLALSDGQLRWHYKYGAPFETSAVILSTPQGETAMLGSRDGVLLALDVATGALRWHTNVDGDMRAPPQLAGNFLVVTTATNKVSVLDATTGTVVWQQGRPASAALTVEGHARAAVANGRVYATFSDGYASAFDLVHGTVLWSRPLSMRSGGSFVDADADPIVKNGRLFVASYSDGIYALNPDDGQTVWNKFAPAVISLADAGTHIVAASADGFVWGLAEADGAPVFRTRLANGPVSRLVVHKDLIVLTAGQVGLVVLDAKNGQPLQATAFGGRAGGDPAWLDDNVAFLTSSGYLYAWKSAATTSTP